MKIVFAGTPEIAAISLRYLHQAGFSPELVLTRPDAPIGRKRVLQPSAVAAFAEQHDIPVLKTRSIDGSLLSSSAEIPSFDDFDLGVVVAFGGLIKEPILSAPQLGWINLHFSDLPAYRGAAPVQRAILAGETKTALSIFRLVAELDAGDIVAARPVSFLPEETADEALERFGSVGAEFLVECVKNIAEHGLRSSAQEGSVSFAPKFIRSDGKLDWQESAQNIMNRYRAVTSEPGAYFEIDGLTVKVIEMTASTLTERGEADLVPGEFSLQKQRLYVGTATTPLQLERVQPAGKQSMPAADWWRGFIQSDPRRVNRG